MRLLVLSQYFWPETFGVNQLVSALVRKQIHVTVLTGKPNYPDGQVFSGYRSCGIQHEEFAGAHVVRVPLVPRGNRSSFRLAMNYLSFIFSGYLLAPFVLRGKPFDAVFVYAPSPILQALPAIFLAWLKRAPLVLWVQDLWPESLSATGYVRNRYVISAIRQLVRFIYSHSDLILVQSRAFEAPVAALAPATPIVYYPNSVDEAFAAPATQEAPYVSGLDAGFSVMFAGNIGTAQAIEVIVKVACLLKDYPDIHFVVIGEGSRWTWMKQEVQRRGLNNVHLPGRFPVELMPCLMQKASVLLVTLADQEIFKATIPSKVQAYLAAGRPILACLNGEGADLVTCSGAGLAVPAENEHALAEAVLRLYRMSPEERETIGALGRLYYSRNFSHEMLIDQLVGHLQTVGSYQEESE